MVLGLYFIVPAFWVLLTTLFVTMKPNGIMRWMIKVTTKRTKDELVNIPADALKPLYKSIRNCLLAASIITLVFAIIFCAPGIPKNNTDFFTSNIWLLIIGFFCVISSFSKAYLVGNAIFSTKDKNTKKGNYILEGMIIGMTLGTAIGVLLLGNMIYGTSLFMCLGMIGGVAIPKTT